MRKTLDNKSAIRNPKSAMGSPDLSVTFAGIKLKNPVLTASGTFGYGEEFAEFVDLNLLGGVIVKGISLKPIKGNPPPRIWETPSGMLNAIGLENHGGLQSVGRLLDSASDYAHAEMVPQLHNAG